ncbi:UPF0160 protein MYG1, mitochondrial-like [Microcaecilia unicolor]|uniref:UPF0160 protein MYG1, mitochondrial-like n=1 Tax=Microcaecilia unicolor TaxID=1415580 RepID=A0A6P7YI18_9AMPH|nr:UPF0160 protein MYG1, mitochondrial-like [Microcaecilia unicolor]
MARTSSPQQQTIERFATRAPTHNAKKFPAVTLGGGDPRDLGLDVTLSPPALNPLPLPEGPVSQWRPPKLEDAAGSPPDRGIENTGPLGDLKPFCASTERVTPLKQPDSVMLEIIWEVLQQLDNTVAKSTAEVLTLVNTVETLSNSLVAIKTEFNIQVNKIKEDVKYLQECAAMVVKDKTILHPMLTVVFQSTNKAETILNSSSSTGSTFQNRELTLVRLERLKIAPIQLHFGDPMDGALYLNESHLELPIKRHADCINNDHHQRSFAETMNSLRPDKPWQTKLSSAGLIYVHFGLEILASLLGTDENDSRISMLYDKLYDNFIEEIDAIDNGISQWDGEPRYAITTNLSAQVGHLNPRWNDKEQDTEAEFRNAMKLVGGEFLDRLDFYQNSWLPARSLVEEAVHKRFEVDSGGEIVIFAQGGCPWKKHIFHLEQELCIEKPIKFVLYTDQNSQWWVQCIPVTCNTFQNRLTLLEKWRGLRDEELSKICGIPGCIFVHASGFIGGNQTREGALQMAQKTLTAQETTNEQ